MDKFNKISTLKKDDYPFLLKQLEKIPDKIDMIGVMPPETSKFLCVVGSRGNSSYGQEVCEKLIAGLTGYPIVIVSGLAIGIDSIAHKAAIKAGLRTIAFPGTGLAEWLLSASKKFNLMNRIIDSGGALLSIFPREQTGTRWTFPVRNKIMAGISHATLVIEAKEKSGTLLTANDTNEIGRTVLAVPGSIFSHLSIGPNTLIRDGATAVTCSADILEAFGFNIDVTHTTNETPKPKHTVAEQQNMFGIHLSDDEKMLINRLTAPIERNEFIRRIDLPTGYINAVLTELELKGVITERQGLLMVN